VAYNDQLSCVQWCKYAKACVGEEMYEQLMKIAENKLKLIILLFIFFNIHFVA
jgi:hypothetical protein